MHSNGAYFSNYDIWLKDPVDYYASAQIVEPLIHQDILNSDIGDLYFQGIDITSGIFQLWRASGIITDIDMQYACSASLIGTMISMVGSYFHLHISYYSFSLSFFIYLFPLLGVGSVAFYFYSPVYKKFKSLCSHHLSLLFGLSSIIWGAHEYHIGMPANALLDSGITLSFSFLSTSIGRSEDLFLFLNMKILLAMLAHHFYVGILFILGGLIALALRGELRYENECHSSEKANLNQIMYSWDAEVGMNLAMGATLSIGFANHQNAIPVYPYCASDYARVLSLFYHHIWVGSLLIIGSSTHASIFIIGDYLKGFSLPTIILKHRDLIIGHLIWVTSFLGLHSFSMYIHNDSLQAFCRGEDIFDDNSIQLKPVFAAWVQDTRNRRQKKMSLDIKILDKKLIGITEELGSADFILHHIHAFTIHQALLILCKAILYARNSR